MIRLIKEIFAGFIIGVANIIPGVSGGTFLLILGMYQRVMAALSGLKADVFKELFVHLAGFIMGKEKRREFDAIIELFEKIDIWFLIRVMAGAGIAIVLLSDLMMFLLTKQFSTTYAFFFGLIAVSTIMSMKLMQRVRGYHLFFLIAGAAATIAVTVAVDPSESIKAESAHYKLQYEQQEMAKKGSVPSSASSPSSLLQYHGRYSAADFTASALSGAVAVCAMILPGISGSLVLVLTGQYFEVLNAISGLRTMEIDYVIFLSVFALGMLFGLLLFARLVNLVFNRFYDSTIAFLTGLMAGSLYTLWPFKKILMMDEYIKGADGITLVHDAIVRTNGNILPAGAHEALLAILFCTAGIVIMVLLSRYEKKDTTTKSGT